MRITLVGKRNNRRVICWRVAIKFTVLTTTSGTVLATLAYLLLAQRWNPLAPLAGLAAGSVASVLCVLANLMTPIWRLPIIAD